jgi:hypothetical protein
MYFILKISANLFGSLELTLSSQPSFENLQEFGLRLSSNNCYWSEVVF